MRAVTQTKSSASEREVFRHRASVLNAEEIVQKENLLPVFTELCEHRQEIFFLNDFFGVQNTRSVSKHLSL